MDRLNSRNDALLKEDSTLSNTFFMCKQNQEPYPFPSFNFRHILMKMDIRPSYPTDASLYRSILFPPKTHTHTPTTRILYSTSLTEFSQRKLQTYSNPTSHPAQETTVVQTIDTIPFGNHLTKNNPFPFLTDSNRL